MRIGFVGLGKMGLNMALNVTDSGWEIVDYDISEDARSEAERQGINVVSELEELLEEIDDRKIIFLSTPAGTITNELVLSLLELLSDDDIIIDSGNSNCNSTFIKVRET